MQREPMIFAAAGTIFGFVLGYMVASVGGEAPRPAGFESASPRAGGGPAASGAASIGDAAPRTAPRPTAVDPNELHALESLATREPRNADVRLQLGNMMMDHEQFGDAVRWYREALALQPDNLDARVDMGASLVNSGKAADGLVEFEQVLKANPNHKKALFNKGVALMESGRPKDAVTVWDDLLRRFPNDPQLQGLKEQIEQVRAQHKSAS